MEYKKRAGQMFFKGNVRNEGLLSFLVYPSTQCKHHTGYVGMVEASLKSGRFEIAMA